MKKSFERNFVVILFVLVVIIFSFAERDTQKLFEKYNMKSTVELPSKTPSYTSEANKKLSIDKDPLRN